MNPYADALGDHDPLAVLAATPERLRTLLDAAGPAAFSTPLGEGKWLIEQLLVHLVHTEMTFGVRYRLALTVDPYVVQPFDQDLWMAREPVMYGADALEAFVAVRAFTLPLLRGLTPADRARAFTHPERGQLTLWTYVETHAGHDLHHLAQIERALA